MLKSSSGKYKALPVHVTQCSVGTDFVDIIIDITFTSRISVGGVACMDIQFIVDLLVEGEESTLQNSDIILAVVPNVSTNVIGE